MDKEIKFGYEVGSGELVAIPISHMVVTGVTQMAGKTTLIESLIKRSGRKAIVFRTKIGEKSFLDGRVIRPFFRERSDWQFVQGLVEATIKERLRTFERSKIIQICKKVGGNSLWDFKKEVDRRLLEPKINMFERDILTNLQAYLELVLPKLNSINFSPTLDLVDGLNIIDLERFSMGGDEVQSLVIRSVAEEVLYNHKNVTIVLPEAWKFLPQSRGNVCKWVVEEFIRQGATNGNFIWCDSQDLANTDKAPLKQVSVWCLIPNTLIRTADGWQEIQKIRIGDKVLTHNGRFRAVTKIMKREYVGKIRNIRVFGSHKRLQITPEHLVLCEKIFMHGILNKTNSVHKLATGELKKYKYSRPIKASPAWISAEKIDREHLLMFPIQKEKVMSIHSNGFVVNEDLMRITGWYLAEGFRDGIYNTGFALGHVEDEEGNEILTAAKSFDINGDLRHTSHGIRVRLFSKKMQEFLSSNFGRGAKNKRIPPWIFDLDNDLISIVLDCYTRGDGHQLKANKSRFKNSTISENLSLDMRDIAIRLGYPYSISPAKSTHNLKYISQYDISKERSGNRQKQGRVGIDNDYLYLRVRENKEEDYDGYVYNLEVEEDNSYSTILGVVHNCLGYQSEINEVKHTLNQIPLPKSSKPKEDEIMTLKTGEFFLATRDRTVKIYAQPFWLDDERSIKVAKGELVIDEKVKMGLREDYMKGVMIDDSIMLDEAEREHIEVPLLPSDDELIQVKQQFSKELNELAESFIKQFRKLQDQLGNLSSTINSLRREKSNVDEDSIVRKIITKLWASGELNKSNGEAGGNNIDEEELISKVLSRVSTTGVVYEVAPLEKIKKNFMNDAKNKVIADVSKISDEAKKMLLYIESAGRGVKTNELITKCFFWKDGGAQRGKIANVSKALLSIEVIRKDTSGTHYSKLKERIKYLMEDHNAEQSDIDLVYNHILVEILK